ncbi:MAG: hypothetical protein HFH94_06000 [Lachnospiraceae bacterium]|jgi:hypothetical protein|nr:hypothetical protein [uncultured Acetatifactor sp.]MCI9219274.1 hypothetical protein [Lachnospiraceae bacterium]
MMSKGYLISTLENNCFYVKAEICLHGKTIKNRFKLDTGCSYSTVPYRVLYNVSYNTSLRYKQLAIDSKLAFQRSYGVSDTDEVKARDKNLVKDNRLLECTALKFTHKDIPITLNGYRIRHDIAVNYDRTSNILIGMDILKDFDFHCGESEWNGEYLFLGCLKEKINAEYLNELHKHFGYISPL